MLGCGNIELTFNIDNTTPNTNSRCAGVVGVCQTKFGKAVVHGNIPRLKGDHLLDKDIEAHRQQSNDGADARQPHRPFCEEDQRAQGATARLFEQVHIGQAARCLLEVQPLVLAESRADGQCGCGFGAC